MEKRTPHYSLAEIKAFVAERGALAFTRTAMDNGHAMGLIAQDMIEVVCSMTIQRGMTSTMPSLPLAA